MIIISFVGCTLQYGLSYSGLNIIDGTSATLFVQAEIPFGILIAFFLCWTWIELTLFISSRFVSVNLNEKFINKFIWYLRFIAISLLIISFIYMYYFQNADLQQAIQYCLGIINK